MFGAIRNERYNKKKALALKQEAALFNKNKAEQMPGLLREEERYNKEKMDRNIASASQERERARVRGREYAKEVSSRPVQGLDTNQRKAMQYEANRHVDRDLENANRELLGNQSRRGIVGGSGVGFAQQKDLQRQAGELRGGIHRDLDKLNADMMEKRRAQEFGIEQGEAAQYGLDRQIAQDEINLEKERKRQRQFEDRFYQQFSRV